jgi:hypothetical protein
MNIRTKAAIETLKMLAAFVAGGVAFYFLIDFFGPKVGMVSILIGMIVGLSWTMYDYFVHKFTWEEKN